MLFRSLNPDKNHLGLGNDSSCVLRIDNGETVILLTGDIEKEAELNLLKQYPSLLKANILSAPHHGSKTSGVFAFLKAVNPQYVLYSTGFHNRYHFPHPSVKASYRMLHTIQLNTAKTGAIEFKLKKNKIVSPDLYRLTHAHYWFYS